MKSFLKGIAFVLITVILFLLCLTPMVFATEEPTYSGDVPLSSSIGIKLAEERSLPEAPLEAPSDAEEEKPWGQEHFESPEPSSEPADPEEPSEPEPSEPEPSKPEPSEPEPSEPEQSKPEPSEPEPSAPEPSEPEQSKPEPPGDDVTELPVATPSVAVAMPFAVMKTVPPETNMVSTGEELLQWLSDYGDKGGVVMLSDDIYLSDFVYVHGFRKPAVTIDTGEYSIIAANGYAELHAGSPLTIRGLGGENGVLRAAEGGMLQISGLTLEAEEGYAVFQEEGAGFLIEQTSVSGDIHYAKLPYVSEWEEELVVEERGKLFDAGHLPAVLQGRVIRQGRITDFYEKVPVSWDLTGHEEAQKQRRRFTVTGEFENMAASEAPVCTVTYDDFPFTFLEVSAKKITGGRGDTYKFSGSFSKPEDRLPVTIAQEYSLDGENWALYEENVVDDPKDTFTIYLPVWAGEQKPAAVFIRLSWNDGGTMYYSNVLRFAEDSLEESGEHGGNRGGGTDIVDPPGTPEPDPKPTKPETTPPPETSQPEPTQPGHDDSDHDSGGSGDGESSSTKDSDRNWDAQGPAQEIASGQNLPGGLSGSGGPAPAVTAHAPGQPFAVTELPCGRAPESSSVRKAVNPLGETGEKPESHKGSPSKAGETPGGTPPVRQQEAPADTDGKSLPPFPEENPQAAAEPGERSAPQMPDAISIVAGLAAIAASMGGAALYLHPKVWKRLVGRMRTLLWNLLKR